MRRWFQRLRCWLGWHRFFKITRLSAQSDHIGCKACRRQWGMNHDVRVIVPWDDVRSLYVELGYRDQEVARAAFAKVAAK
jgi:hypothetical protein